MREVLKKLRLIFLLFPVLWLLSGFYSVDQNEMALPVLLGRTGELQGPGIHYNAPYPLCEILIADIKKTETVTIGYGTMDYDGMDSQSLKGSIITYTGNSRDILFMDMNKFNQQFMTGDENIISLEMEITFNISQPEKWFFNFSNPRKLIEKEAASLISETVGTGSIDRILVRDPKVEFQMQEQIQKIINLHDCGAEITSVTFRNVNLPVKKVEEAFRDVKSAEDDRTKRIEEAKREATAILSEGNTEARELKDRAIISAASLRTDAQSQFQEFEKLLLSRERDNQFDYRLYLETMEELLGQGTNYLINPMNTLDTVLIERKDE